MSPHVFEIDGKSMHYKMPVNAISSIINRATGVALSAGENLHSYLSEWEVQKICLCAHKLESVGIKMMQIEYLSPGRDI